ncbi:MAG: hypothetical protein ACR2GO_07120, partial [Candidatus Limnocylindria bacterium]
MSASVLDELLDAARRRSRADARITPLAELRRQVASMPPARRFEALLRGAGRVSVIAEAKRASPSAGSFDLGPGSAAVVELARGYARAGVAALSILTEPTRFAGSDDDLIAAARIGLPALRKDFAVDRYGVWQARALGADAVLLIVRALGDGLLRRLIVESGEAGLDALVEVHDTDELEIALDADATLIGVNARDLATLTVDLDAALPLLRRAADAGATVVAESGIANARDVASVAEAGAAAVLVGTSLLRSGDPSAAAAALVRTAPRRNAPRSLPSRSRALVKACGMRSAAGIRAAMAADADFVGFVLDPASSRAVDAERAAELMPSVRGRRPVLVFRSPSRTEVATALSTTGAGAIQLAGFDGPPPWTSDVASSLETVIGVIHAPKLVRATLCLAETWIAAGATHLLLEGAATANGGGSADGAPIGIARRLGRIVPVGVAGGLTPRNVTRAVRDARPALVDAASGLEHDGGNDPARIGAFVRNARREPTGADRVDHQGRFGRFGGRFVPETLIPALDDLEAAWNLARRDPDYRRERERLHRDFIGRPTPLFAIPASALAQRGGRGASVWLKREDLAHTGAHKI